jgi:beta-fructofuranosidase
MGLAFDDRWIWDFWLIRDNGDHHVFYLQAPMDIGHPDDRHWHASIGHAVSQDLVHWDTLPDALGPGEPGSWDDASTWTGSVIGDSGRWYMLYTGTATAEHALVQRIGMAESADLVHWAKHDGPVLEADPRWYETIASRAWHDQAWRDPWVFFNVDDGLFHVVLTARAQSGEPAERGVVGHAQSPNLHNWEVQPPLTAPMGFGQMEVPQLMACGNRWYLVFCSDLATQGPGRRQDGPGTGTYYLVGASPLGPFGVIGGGVLQADRQGSTYAGKLHHTTEGQLVYLTWHRTRTDGSFHGALSDPRPVEILADGALHLRST